MLLQMQGIGKPKIQYKDHQSVEFDTLNNYLLLAKKAISKFGNQFYHGLSMKMLKDEDAISSVANAIMMADWRWDDNYTNEKGTKKNRYSYRNQCALWAIQTYITKNNKSNMPHKDIVSLDFIIGGDSDNSTIQSITKDNKMQSPVDTLIKQEKEDEIKFLIDSMLSIDCISARQKDYIRLYYFDGYTFEKIGQKYNITREAVRQGLNKALETIRNSINDSN